MHCFEPLALASLREKLLSINFYPWIVNADTRPTSITVAGAYRVCSIDTQPDEIGEPICCNAFLQTSEVVIKESPRTDSLDSLYDGQKRVV